ncbi:single-stranded DNA-binding protein [Microbacterium esteraromaticum]|uniref:single-stranded DNA-binding protein n=1 Tax=Microbacterium esteraromaticum TaxID=57043 RepID=UPI00195C29AA|nr:single-stranded DNA-binding protein [Microbacterium esteraromaticum]MBM7464685.1 single-strand DNA-binding protein [Microbacterium esteraromaticum]
MSISNDVVTIAGNIGNDPISNETRAGKAVINFRVATTSGYFDQRTGAWVENGTNWYAVSAFGNLAEHAKGSLHRGHPVIVVGRLRQREWEANGKKGIDIELTADAIGHDLRRGTSAFVRRPRAGQGSAPAQSEEAPRDDEPTSAEHDAWGDAGLVPTGDGDVATDLEGAQGRAMSLA